MAANTVLSLYHAPSVGDLAVPPGILQIEEALPDFSSVEEADDVYRDQARRLAEFLWMHLPGAVIDRLLLILLERQVALLRVRQTRLPFT